MASTVTIEPVSASVPSKTLDCRDFVGFFVAVKMRQHQSRVGSKGAEYVRGTAVEEVAEAPPQGLTIDRHMTLTCAVHRVVQYGGMAAERPSTETGCSCHRMPRIVV